MNMGPLLLEGGAEFGGRMSEPDLRAIDLAGGMNASIRIIPTAAAPDNNHIHAGNNGAHWFKGLGATDVGVLYVIDQASAQDAGIAAALRTARLIYLLGGFPRYLGETLSNSPAWEAALAASETGAVIAGSSAGAMVLCEHYFDPYGGKLLKGLNLLPNACVIPHYNTMGQRWLDMLTAQRPDSILIGIDEETGMLLENSRWTVHGAGTVTIHAHAEGGTSRVHHTYAHGAAFSF